MTPAMEAFVRRLILDAGHQPSSGDTFTLQMGGDAVEYTWP